ncbi:MAG TPA: pitrilysin family protein [Egibacteraceae bacterium]|nr:pitrilysin family protein [Egibacteraceae bacterium]
MTRAGEVRGRGASADPASESTADGRSDGVSVSVLDSGVRVVTEAVPGMRSVAVGFWVSCGSRDEREPVAGASHFLEHLLFKGTRRRTALEIAETIDAVGGEMNAFTSKEYTCFYARCLDRDVPLAVDVLADMIVGALIRARDVDAERDVVLEEIRMHRDAPDDLVHSVFSEALFRGHPLGREVLGSEDTITAMTRDQVNRYYRRQYVPANLVVAAAGNLDHAEVVRLVEEALAPLDRDGAGIAPRRPPGAPGAASAVIRTRPTEQAHIVLGAPGLARDDERRYAASVLNQALGGGMASRLFQEVRERRGLVYSVYSYHGMHADSGAFAVYAGTAPRRAPEVLQVVRAELDKARSGGLGDAELARAKGNLTGSLVLGQEDTSSRMSRLGKALTTGSPLLTLDELIASVEAVTVDDVRAVAERLLGGPFTLAMVGPFPEGAEADFIQYVQDAA